MDEIKDHLKDISEIRGMMERSSRFLSLSGLSGISSGLIAIVGAVVAGLKVGWEIFDMTTWGRHFEHTWFLLADAMLVLIVALAAAILFSMRMAKKQNHPIWNKTAKLLLGSMLVPLVAGGVLTLIMFFRGSFIYIPGVMLMFYGIALVNGGKFTISEIKFLGYSEIILGLCAAFWWNLGPLFWVIGFGAMHIVYGTLMYFKYER